MALQDQTESPARGADAADVTVVGGGILGLAVAGELAGRWPDRRIELLEKEPELARHQTGHNSGVIHSGIYYRPGSSKARHCTGGAARMVAFCAEHGIAHRICGKLVVARHPGELAALDELHRRGVANGVAGVELVEPARMRAIEPHVAGVRALWVPGAGIVDYREVARKMAEVARARGVAIHTGRALEDVVARGDGLELVTGRGRLRTRYLVNCGGLHADRLARRVAPVSLRIVPFRGEYYELVPERRDLVRGLIYPVPDPRLPFLGVHFTRRIDGSVEAGPNAVLALHREGYGWGRVSLRDVLDTAAFPGFWRMAARHLRTGVAEVRRSLSKRAFVRDLQRLVPEVRGPDLRRGGSGVRAQAIDRGGRLLDDFALVESPRALHVCNAPSPAATASLSIAEEIADRVARAFDL